jgi:hypothetical protein
MKKIIFLVVFILGIGGMVNAATTLTIDGKYAMTVDDNVQMPGEGEIMYVGGADAETMSWGFPVHYDDGRGHTGDWYIGGSGEGSWEIACQWILDWFNN